MANPKVLFSKLIGKVNTGGVILKLFADTTPKTTENFRALCNLEKGVGISGRPLHYYGSSFHRANPGFMFQGEVFTRGANPGFMFQGEVFTRGYASCAEATYGLKNENLNLKQTGASIRIASNAESGSEFQEIIADYVHHEMTRTWILVLMRLFMIIAIKDVFVSLVYSDKTTKEAST